MTSHPRDDAPRWSTNQVIDACGEVGLDAHDIALVLTYLEERDAPTADPNTPSTEEIP